MEFTLEEFAGEELKTYEVTRKIVGNIDNPKPTDYKFNAEMLICKKTLKGYNPNLQDGGRIIGVLSGKTLKVVGLKLDDVIEVEGYKYKVTEILPRIYADFVEFSLELMRNGQ
jgi:hypothetical protein fuD12_05973